MGVNVVKTMAWTCDRKGCNENGHSQDTKQGLPDGWNYFTFGRPKTGQPNEMHGILCPTHSDEFRKFYEGKRREEKVEEKTGEQSG